MPADTPGWSLTILAIAITGSVFRVTAVVEIRKPDRPGRETEA
ncbi:MAG: hypothetical protein ACK5WW_08245 [Brevundimonas sp.]|nr:hypothetical protein [Brevundimonas sp.]MCZ8087985.1 hypothetical protein [Brevundimonas sp.]MCZ8194751.1 hypothetical protein [Brevundimonas sp.]